MRLVAAVLALAIAPTLARQDPAGTGSISGRVIDAGSSQPIAAATVAVGRVHGPAIRSVQSDADGAFVIAGLPAGVLSLTSRKAGYVGGGFGLRDPGTPPQDFDLQDGERAADIVLRVWKPATLSGSVAVGAGRPLAGVEVTAFPVGVIAGRFGIESGRRTTTDAAGRYQFDSLSPGRYLVSAMPAAARPVPSGRAGGGGAREQLFDYPRVFYPDAVTASDAKVFDLAAGAAETDVRFVLRERPMFPVSGVVSGQPAGTTIAHVDLVPEAGAAGVWSDMSAATASVDAAGAFSFPRVLPGRYVARVVECPDTRTEPGAIDVLQMAFSGSVGFAPASGSSALPLSRMAPDPTWWGEARVVVADGAVAGVSIALERGARISGAVVFDGTATKPSSDSLRQSAIGIVAPRGRQLPPFQLARLEGDGAFTSAGLPPGTYALVPVPGLRSFSGGAPTWPEAWSSVRTTIDGQDQPGELIELGRADLKVTVTLTEAPTRLSGVVRDAGGGVPPDASVYIFRSDRRLWRAGAPSREVRPSRRGGYEADLPPGEYFVTASVTAPVLWKEAASLEALASSAVLVRLTRGEKRTLDLVIR